MTVKVETILGLCLGNCAYPPHVEPQVKLHAPNEETFSIPLEDVDVVRRTEHDIGCVAGNAVLKMIWNIDGGSRTVGAVDWVSRNPQYWLKKLMDWYKCPRGWLTKIQATSKVDNLKPENWSNVGRCSVEETEARQRKNKGKYFTDPNDIEFKHTMKIARNVLELSMECAMACNVHNLGHVETCGENLADQNVCASCTNLPESASARLNKKIWRSHCWKRV